MLSWLFAMELLTACYPLAAACFTAVLTTPLLAQVWASLTLDNPLYQFLHERLPAHLLPALWTTYAALPA